MPIHYLHLALAIAAEVAATSALAASAQFTRLGPSLIVVAGYGAAFYFLSLTLEILPVGIVYAIWSGLGVVFVALIGFLVFGQRLDLPAIVGMALIIAGVLVINLMSGTARH
ncbi:MAG: QacE family quaternary ammonium compound efflux SMR transporter [Rhodobacteraceae bacterium]|nr:QacE family quaternary ammonium compound efflux SMR transporter [Paracoccaceae bacterium]